MSAAAQKAVTDQPVDKRSRLLDAALALFESRGFDGVTVPEIARSAGVATGTLYLYFKDKAALVNALYRHWKGAYNALVLAPLPHGTPPREAFARYWRRMMRFARAHPQAMRFMDLHHHAAYLDDSSRAMARDYVDVAQAFACDAREAGAIRDLDPLLIVALTWGAAAGLAKFSGQGLLRLDEAAATAMEDALWRAIAKEEDGHGTQAQG